MTSVNVEYALSKRAALDLFAQTGTQPEIVRVETVELEPLTVEQRRTLLSVAYHPTTGSLRKIDAHGQKVFSVTHPDDLSAKAYPVEFDHEPTAAELVEAVATLAGLEAKRKAEAEGKAEAERVRFAQQKEDEKRIKTELDAIEKALDLAASRAYPLPENAHSNLVSYKSAAVRDIERKIEDAEKARWVAAHGSSHLQRACAAGYNCQRLYVVERAALEAPLWIVDYNNSGQERNRACPSAAALDVAEAARPLAEQLGLDAPIVIWLTEEPSHEDRSHEDDGDGGSDEQFAPCEAVMMRYYLGKHYLYKIV